MDKSRLKIILLILLIWGVMFGISNPEEVCMRRKKKHFEKTAF